MSIDKSLRRKNTLQRSRNVLTRGERILRMKRHLDDDVHLLACAAEDLQRLAFAERASA